MTVIDFFCGAGGFSEGFRQQGFEILGGYDKWQPAVDSFNHNFNTNSNAKDMLEFKDSIEEIEKLPDTDIIIGSPPCVTFSSSNISGKADKESGVILTKILLRIIAVKKYKKDSKLKAWFMENVANSVNYLADYYTFKDLGLGEWAKENRISPTKKAIILKDNQSLINSADYGSYQSRIRAISGEIISIGKLIVPEPIHSNEEESTLPKWKTLGQLIKQFPLPNMQNCETEIVDPIYPKIKLKIEDLTDHFYDSGLYKSEWRQSREHKINHYCMGRMSFPEDLNKPSRTITATKSGTSREALIYKSEYIRKGDGEYRSPTVREAASIMGFPFTYQFLGSPNNKWRLVGNAVCPSVSRVFASELLIRLGIKPLNDLQIITEPNLNGVENLNDFKEKEFNAQPRRTKNSRFRRHPFKAGNLTVTLSNFDIEKNSKADSKWQTSIQYGTGEKFKNQFVEDGFYKKIENLIKLEKDGEKFINIINNGFSEKIASSKLLQDMYEKQVSREEYLEPTELIEKVNDIVLSCEFTNEVFDQNGPLIFLHKKQIPTKQLFALYAINKISTIANTHYE